MCVKRGPINSLIVVVVLIVVDSPESAEVCRNRVSNFIVFTVEQLSSCLLQIKDEKLKTIDFMLKKKSYLKFLFADEQYFFARTVINGK